MKKPSKKVIQTARLIISEGVEGFLSNIGKDGYPSESDFFKAERLLDDLLDLKKNQGGK
jgi:hypothetical protein